MADTRNDLVGVVGTVAALVTAYVLGRLHQLTLDQKAVTDVAVAAANFEGYIEAALESTNDSIEEEK